MALINLGSIPANSLGSIPANNLGSIPANSLGSIIALISLGSNPAINLGSSPASNLGSIPAKSLGSSPAIAAADEVAIAAAALALVGAAEVPEDAAVVVVVAAADELADEDVADLPSKPVTIFGSIPAACRSLGSIPANTFGSGKPLRPIMVLGSNPSILGSRDAKVLGSNPAAWKSLGSIPANNFGSIPSAAAALFKVEEGVDVLGAIEVFGDLRSSELLTLALDGGLGEALGELLVLEVVGVVVVLVLAFEPPMNISIPGIS